MGDNLASKVPPVVIYSTEFDFYLKCAEESADLYRRNGTLLDFVVDFVVLSGVWHGHFGSFTLKKTDVWFNDVARICKKYLAPLPKL